MWWIYFILTVVSSEEVNQTVDLESARGRPQISDGQEAETHFIIPRSNTKYNETIAWAEIATETITAYDPDVEYFNQRATDFFYNEFVHQACGPDAVTDYIDYDTGNPSSSYDEAVKNLDDYNSINVCEDPFKVARCAIQCNIYSECNGFNYNHREGLAYQCACILWKSCNQDIMLSNTHVHTFFKVPVTLSPTSPTGSPTDAPSETPTTSAPTTTAPTVSPPTKTPTTAGPTTVPPTASPTSPTLAFGMTHSPTFPSRSPTSIPTSFPTASPPPPIIVNEEACTVSDFTKIVLGVAATMAFTVTFAAIGFWYLLENGKLRSRGYTRLASVHRNARV